MSQVATIKSIILRQLQGSHCFLELLWVSPKIVLQLLFPRWKLENENSHGLVLSIIEIVFHVPRRSPYIKNFGHSIDSSTLQSGFLCQGICSKASNSFRHCLRNTKHSIQPPAVLGFSGIKNALTQKQP